MFLKQDHNSQEKIIFQEAEILDVMIDAAEVEMTEAEADINLSIKIKKPLWRNPGRFFYGKLP